MMDDSRPDPDTLLAQIREQEQQAARGKLRIYFGSSAGVGKTYTMLQAAKPLREQGVDVLAGVVVTHGRSDTMAVSEGIPVLPLKEVEYRGKTLPEFDLDAALARSPRLILVDELAHSNVAGSRHPKRWQDVEELLAHGIDVYTTLNVQHLESLNDIIGSITGVRVQETLPDTFFDAADEVVMVDTPADELLARLKAGKVYQGPAAERAANNFFRKGNLMALRELALRRTADRVEDDVQAWRSNQRVATVWQTAAALLCAIGPSPQAESVVRGAARLAQQLNVSWHAVYVESNQLQRLPDAERERILGVVRLAHELGATTSVLQNDDVAEALAAHAREHNLSRLVIGRPQSRRGKKLGERLSAQAPELDLIQVAAGSPQARARAPETDARDWGHELRRYGLAASACAATTALCWPLQWHIAQANIVMLYLLVVLIVALRLGRRPSVLASFLSVGLFDFFFVPPKLSFAVSDVQYLLTFGVMLAVGLITGQLTAGLRWQARVAADRESRSRALFELTSDLAGALQAEQVLQVAEKTLASEIHGEALLFVLDLRDQLQPSPQAAASQGPDAPDAGTARWAFDHAQAAGLATDTLPGSAWFYLPLIAPMRTRGVVALRPRSREAVLQPEARAQLETFGRIIAQALERVHYVEVAQGALVQIESERLRNSLLSALSHDLRTPLAVVYGLAQTLAAMPLAPEAHELSDQLRQQSQRVSAMVTNLLDMARLQSGAVRLNLQWQPIEEIVGTSLRALEPVLAGHEVRLDLPADLPLLNLDAALMDRVLGNLLENAAKYTPPGSRITISAALETHTLALRVADNGPGLPPGKIETLFDKFTRGEHESSTPGVGLGLAICRAIVEAHGGSIDTEPGERGAVFVIHLPLGQPPAVIEAE
jgi:two-component system sensor histidine kinase KdpD